MHLVFRYDDFGAGNSPEFCSMEEKILNLFFSLDLPMVIGAIPFRSKQSYNPHNKIFYPISQETRCIEILSKALERDFQLALHGLNHQTWLDQSKTEFSNQGYDIQLDKIREGYEYLSQLFPNSNIDIFIPPWDSFDNLTINAVSEVGIPLFCCGENVEPQYQNDVLIIPSFKISGFVNYVRHYSLDNLADLVGDSYLVITLHTYEFLQLDNSALVSFCAFSDILHISKIKGIPIHIIPTGENHLKFISNQNRLLSSRLYLFSIMHTKLGSVLFMTGRWLSHIFGKAVETMVLDLTAYALRTLKTSTLLRSLRESLRRHRHVYRGHRANH